MFVSKGNIKFLFYMYTYDDMPLLMSMNGHSLVSKFARVHAPQIMALRCIKAHNCAFRLP